jgi:hypothetical protein
LKFAGYLTDSTENFRFEFAEIVKNDNKIASIKKFDTRLAGDVANAVPRKRAERITGHAGPCLDSG